LGHDRNRRQVSFTPDDVEAPQDVFDQTRIKVWQEQPSDFFDEAVLDVDGTLVATGAGCKQGIDIADDGTWGALHCSGRTALQETPICPSTVVAPTEWHHQARRDEGSLMRPSPSTEQSSRLPTPGSDT
jgi:hypothetical protein